MGAFPAVNLIPQDRRLKVLQVYPDLVGAARVGPGLHQGVGPCGGEDPKLRLGVPGSHAPHMHLVPLHRVAANGGDEGSLLGVPLGEGQVALHHQPVAEGPGKGLHRSRVFGHHQNAAGVLVQAVDDARAHPLGPCGRQGFRNLQVPAQKGVHHGTRVDPGGRVGEEARGFVQDQEVLVLVKHGDGKVLRDHHRALLWGLHLDLFPLEAVGGLFHHPIPHPHPALGNPGLSPGPAHAAGLGHRLVQAHPLRLKAHHGPHCRARSCARGQGKPLPAPPRRTLQGPLG
ncbi:hypothetical protein A0O31_01583 [Thermus brockianus]|uniref:Uncharacterized protein n=1 Tax=Thermus brockianus TaxID=56956 RepID=A0A1J0LUL5_THEBO|nr:hypothetical protein A0O31_01583 [Thermus brockianus]